MGDLGPTELRLMQGLAQQVTALRPELLNGDATVGELAWVWAKDFDAQPVLATSDMVRRRRAGRVRVGVHALPSPA